MKRNLLNRIRTQALAVAAVLAFCSTALAAQNPAPAVNAPRTDGQIEMDVVQALDGAQDLKNDLITAATIQGQVTLSGTVASDAHKQLAETIAAKVGGVSKVNNNLKVGNPADDANAPGAVQDNGAPPMDNGQAHDAGYPPQGYPQQSQGNPQAPGYPQQPGYPQEPGAPQQPGYGQSGYPPAGQGFGRQAYNSQPRSYAEPKGPVTIAQGTLLQLRTTDSLSDKRAKDGTPVDFTVIRDVAVKGYLAIPRGAMVHGIVTESKSAGRLAGAPVLALQLTSLDLGGKSYPLYSDEFKVKGPSKTGHTIGNAVGGALLGALVGGAFGGGGGAAIGAVAGGGAGTAASAAGPNPRAWIPAEALVTFHLSAPVTVDPVSQEEASRLAQGLNTGGPELYRRPAPSGYRGYGYYAYPAYGAPFAPVYYRPYYMMGGYYFWR